MENFGDKILTFNEYRSGPTSVVFQFDANIDDNMKWFDRIFLCVENAKSTTYGPINGFDCTEFNTIRGANYAWLDMMKIDESLKERRHTLIPVCKWVPVPFHKYLINYHLKNIYWSGKHTIKVGWHKLDF